MTIVGRYTIATCLIAVVAEVVLGCTSTTSWSSGDAMILLFIVGPYCLLALLAWRWRHRATASRFLLAVALALAVLGLYDFGLDCYRYHTDSQYRLTQRMGTLFIPLFQWIVVLAVGLLGFVKKPKKRVA